MTAQAKNELLNFVDTCRLSNERNSKKHYWKCSWELHLCNSFTIHVFQRFCVITLFMENLLDPYREIHNLDPQPHRHGMLAPKPSAPRVTRCRLGSIGHVIFFRERLRVVNRELAIQSLISFRCLYLGQIGCQGDEVSRQPAVGGSEIWWCMHSAHSLSTTHRSIQDFYWED